MVAFLILFKRSVIGSTMIFSLPTRFDHTGNLAPMCQRSQTNTTHVEFSVIPSWPSTKLTTVTMPDFEFLCLPMFGKRAFLRHGDRLQLVIYETAFRMLEGAPVLLHPAMPR